jgi:hypothetical protein
MLLRKEVIGRCDCGRRRIFASAGAAIPAVLVALLPKCPVCLAAWFAASAGVGISAVAAGRLRVLLLVLGLAPVIYVLFRAKMSRLRLR